MSDTATPVDPSPTPSNPQVKRYSAKRKTVPVEIEDETGTVRTYTLVEPMGDAKAEFQNLMQGRLIFGPNGNPLGVSEYKGLQVNLIAKCIRDPNDKSMTIAQVDSLFPATLQDALYKDCQTLAGLNKEAADEAKKA